VTDTSSGAARVAVVTGASSGIGAATARELARRGWHCILVARREERLRALAGELGGEFEVCDVSDRAAVEAMAARVLGRHPAVHLLVNNAGIPARGSILSIEPERIERVMAVNYLGGVWCVRALLPALRAAGSADGAHIVNLVSVAGTVAFAPLGAYSASKHAQLAFSRSLRAALPGSGIRVHTVLPGFAETEGFPQKGVLQSRLLELFLTSPEKIARSIADAVEKGRGEVTVPWFPFRPISVLQAVAPGLMARLVGMSNYRRGAD
jgi:short-subunit dehydrogenase